MQFEPGKVAVHKRKHLPHWDAEHGTQFVTIVIDREKGISLTETTAQFVIDTLIHDDGRCYELLAWCVMEDHAHVVLSPRDTIANIVKTWKSVTARRINTNLNRTGTVWQKDYFDRLIRDSHELQRTIDYVLENPANDELFGWHHARVYPDRL